MRSADIKWSNYFDLNKENSNKNPKFEVGDYAGISKYKNIFVNVYTPNGSEEVFVIKKVNNAVP